MNNFIRHFQQFYITSVLGTDKLEKCLDFASVAQSGRARITNESSI